MAAGSTLDQATTFTLPAQADIRSAADVSERCRSALEATGDVRIGCDGVERVDAAILQCLGALARGLREGDRGLELVDPSPAFARAVRVLGFGVLFEASIEPVS